MSGGEALLWLIERAAHELALFAGVGLLIGGIDDLLIDLIWMVRRGWRRATIYRTHAGVAVETLAAPERSGRIAIFIGAWDEGEVIGAMLTAALERLDHDDYRIYLGVYPNDPGTARAARAARRAHVQGHRVRIVRGGAAGPTTKAECLNRVWRALNHDEARDGVRFKAIVLHDAEDVVHPAELRLFDRLIERFDLVQLPVLPLVDARSRWVSGHYIDEFSEAHGKQLVVREALGAGMPSAGVGCAIARDALQRVADTAGGQPFDARSLTEDYELGLKLRDQGGRGIFVHLPVAGPHGRALVAVRAYFPAGLDAAVRQKTRWMTGIALSGWDRLGWRGGIAERWMRLRDRRAILAAVILAAAYGALVLNALVVGTRMATGDPFAPPSALLGTLLWTNTALLGWRLVMRMMMVRRFYGVREALRSAPRMMVGNVIGMMAARRAVAFYLGLRRGEALAWDKTEHHFPTVLPGR